MLLNDTMYKLKGNKNRTVWIFNNPLLILTFLSSVAGYSDQALYKVSQFNAPITSRDSDTVRRGFQQKSGGTAGKLNCYNLLSSLSWFPQTEAVPLPRPRLKQFPGLLPHLPKRGHRGWGWPHRPVGGAVLGPSSPLSARGPAPSPATPAAPPPGPPSLRPTPPLARQPPNSSPPNPGAAKRQPSQVP